MKQKSQNILQLRTLYHNCFFTRLIYQKHTWFQNSDRNPNVEIFLYFKTSVSYMYLSKADNQHLN